MKGLLESSVRPVLFAGLLALVFAPGAAPTAGVQEGPPVVTFKCTPAPDDCTGWYTTNVAIVWTVQNYVIRDCKDDWITTDTPGKVETCYAENQAGQSTLVKVTIKVDKTPPTVTRGVPDRPPDANGWYNHPLFVRFEATDATSGPAWCSASGYSGPDNGAASVTGTCGDNAGHTSAPFAYGFKYDASPPPLRASSRALNRAVVVRWNVSRETQQVAVHRAPTAAKGARQLGGPRVYRGAAKFYLDRHVRNGVSYVYTVVAQGQAGLVSAARVEATPTPLFDPPRDVSVRRPPLLRWARVAGATYYNVQLRRNGRKIFTAWPNGNAFQLRSRWRFQHRRYRLSPGRYEWLVWPGFGHPAEVRYGRLLGQSTFAVKG